MSKPTLVEYLAEVRDKCKVQTSACRTRADVEALVGMVEAWLGFWASCGKPNGCSQHLEFGIVDAVGFKAKLESLIPEENP